MRRKTAFWVAADMFFRYLEFCDSLRLGLLF